MYTPYTWVQSAYPVPTEYTALVRMSPSPSGAAPGPTATPIWAERVCFYSRTQELYIWSTSFNGTGQASSTAMLCYTMLYYAMLASIV